MKARLSARFPLVETAVLVLSLACIVALTTMQQKREQAAGNSYSSYDAGGGGLLAWYELLVREGSNVGRFEERLPFLERDAGVFILADQPFSTARFPDVTESDGSALAGWVRDGGRLLLIGTGTFGTIAARDLHLRRTVPRTAAPSRSAFVASGLERFGVKSFSAAGNERLIAQAKDRTLLRDQRGALAVEYALGRGTVVQVSDSTMFRNADIGKLDHPRLAYGLIAILGGLRARVLFDEALHGYVIPEHWWQVLPRPFVISVVLAIVVLGVALIGAAIRLGPPRDAEPRRAPNTAEYLDALASLMERGHAAGASIRQAFASVRRLVALRLGAPDERSASRLAQRIERADLREAFLELDALASNLAPTNQSLVRGLALAHRLREEYGIDVRGR